MTNGTIISRAALPLMLAVMIFSASLVYAQPFEGGPPCGDDDFVKELGLTDDQLTKFRQHRVESKTEAVKLRMLLKDHQSDLREELGRYDSDTAKINKITSEIKKLQAQLIDHRVASVLELKKILTPEQFEKFQERIDERRERMMHRKGEMHGRRGMPFPPFPEGDEELM